MEKKQETVETSILKDKVKILIFSVIEALLVLLEIYVMLHNADQTIVMIGLAVVILLDLFFLINAAIDMGQKNKQLERKEYEDIYKAQKASYLVIRKYFDQLEERLDRLEDKSALPTDEIISAQKAVAKVTISRSKENTDALMNSNDELINHIFGFEEKLSENNKEIISHQQELINQTKEDILEKNKDLDTRFKELHEALEKVQDNISELEIKAQQAPVMPVPEPVSAQKVVAQQEAVVEPEVAAEVVEEVEAEVPVAEEIPEPVVESEAMDDMENQLDELVKEVENLPEEPVVEDSVAEEPSIEEPVIEDPVEEEKPPLPDLSNPSREMTPEEIQAMFANADVIAGGSEELVVEEIVAQEPVVETSVEEEKPPLPDLSNPSREMTPEEIQAMFANADVITGGSEEPVEEEPVVEEPVEEAKPAMPDLSDPNKVMTPEEIEALLANL